MPLEDAKVEVEGIVRASCLGGLQEEEDVLILQDLLSRSHVRTGGKRLGEGEEEGWRWERPGPQEPGGEQTCSRETPEQRPVLADETRKGGRNVGEGEEEDEDEENMKRVKDRAGAMRLGQMQSRGGGREERVQIVEREKGEQEWEAGGRV
eukprot:58392-Hanusia_phi.AAC.1